jgi:hypothetical protein
VIAMHDDQLERRLLWVLENDWQSPPAAWWNDSTFAYRSCLIRPWLARVACVARGRADATFLLFAIGQDDWAIRSAGYREPAFYIEAVAANPKAYAHLPYDVRYGNSMRQLAILALRDPDMWRLLPNSYEDAVAYLDVLEAQPMVQRRRAAAEVWHTRAPPSLMLHMQKNSRVISCRALMTRAVARCWRELKFATWDIRNDISVVSEAVKCHWRALQYASHELRGNKELMRAAIEQNGLALCFASPTMRSDEDLARLAVQSQRRALQYVDRALASQWTSRTKTVTLDIENIQE